MADDNTEDAFTKWFNDNREWAIPTATGVLGAGAGALVTGPSGDPDETPKERAKRRIINALIGGAAGAGAGALGNYSYEMLSQADPTKSDDHPQELSWLAKKMDEWGLANMAGGALGTYGGVKGVKWANNFTNSNARTMLANMGIDNSKFTDYTGGLKAALKSGKSKVMLQNMVRPSTDLVPQISEIVKNINSSGVSVDKALMAQDLQDIITKGKGGRKPSKTVVDIVNKAVPGKFRQGLRGKAGLRMGGGVTGAALGFFAPTLLDKGVTALAEYVTGEPMQ